MAGQPSTILFSQPTPGTVLSLPDIWVNLRLWSQVMLSPLLGCHFLLESHMLLKGKRQKRWTGGNTEGGSVMDRHSLGTRSTTGVNRATYIYSLTPHSLGIVSIPGTVPRVPGCWERGEESPASVFTVRLQALSMARTLRHPELWTESSVFHRHLWGT